MGHDERHGHQLTGLSCPAANINRGRCFHCICAVGILPAWLAKPLSAIVISGGFFVFYTHRKPNAVLSLQQASLVLHQEEGLGVGEPEEPEDNPPPQRQRSCYGHPCHPSLPEAASLSLPEAKGLAVFWRSQVAFLGWEYNCGWACTLLGSPSGMGRLSLAMIKKKREISSLQEVWIHPHQICLIRKTWRGH